MYDFGKVYEANTVAEAVKLKAEHPEARILAGGSDLLIQMRSGLFAGCDIISIYLADEMRGVTLEADHTIRIGALTSFSHVTASEVIRKYVPALGEAVDKVGGPQIRNIGTIGGNVCNAHTGADSGATLFAYDAIAEITGPDGVRTMPIAEFYRTDGTGVRLERGEILTALLIPEASYSGYYGSHWKYGLRNAMDVDITGCSTNVKLSDDKKTILDMRMAFAVMGPTPIRAAAAEHAAAGSTVSMDTVKLIADKSIEGLSPRTDMRGTKEFRLHTAHVAARRTFIDAICRAGGDMVSESVPWEQGPVTSEMGK